MKRLTAWLTTPIEIWNIDVGPNKATTVPRWTLLFAFCEPQACHFAWTYKAAEQGKEGS